MFFLKQIMSRSIHKCAKLRICLNILRTFTKVGSSDQSDRSKHTRLNLPPKIIRESKEVCRETCRIVYVDGSKGKCTAGIGVWWGEGDALNVSKTLSPEVSNIRAEILASITAIDQAIKINVKKLTVCSDCQFLILSMTKWIHKWRENGWQTYNGTLVKNLNDFKHLDDLCSKIDVEWLYVAAHSGIHGNECADRLAKQAAKLTTSSCKNKNTK